MFRWSDVATIVRIAYLVELSVGSLKKVVTCGATADDALVIWVLA